MSERKASGKRGYADIGTQTVTVASTGSRWKTKLNELFRSRQEKRDIKANEKRAVEIKDIIKALETAPFSECGIEEKFLYYSEKNAELYKGLREDDCLYNATNILIEKLNEPLNFTTSDDTSLLNEKLMCIASDFGECIRRSDIDGAYFCIDVLNNIIFEMRPRIVSIKNTSIRRKYISDVTNYGELASVVSQIFSNLFDLKQNDERMNDVYLGYIDKRKELAKEYSSYIMANGGEELHNSLIANTQTVAQIRAEGDVVLAHILEIASEYQFVQLPLKLAGILKSVGEQKIEIHNNMINNAKNILISFPTLNDENLYNAYHDAVNRAMEETVSDIVKNNKRIENEIAFGNYADEINRQLVAGQAIMNTEGIHALDKQLTEVEEYANIVPLTDEQLEEKRKELIAQKQAKKQIEYATQVRYAEQPEVIQNTNVQSNLLGVDDE